MEDYIEHVARNYFLPLEYVNEVVNYSIEYDLDYHSLLENCLNVIRACPDDDKYYFDDEDSYNMPDIKELV